MKRARRARRKPDAFHPANVTAARPCGLGGRRDPRGSIVQTTRSSASRGDPPADPLGVFVRLAEVEPRPDAEIHDLLTASETDEPTPSGAAGSWLLRTSTSSSPATTSHSELRRLGGVSPWLAQGRRAEEQLRWPGDVGPRAALLRGAAAAAVGTIRSVEAELLAWFEENRRDLPWRRRRDPYAVVVSEVMLQQTQVGRVVPRFEAWMEQWPTGESLAGAGLDEGIRAGQGLGYNRRAVSLHRAARIVVDAGWPTDLTELPGVGGYTAAAVRRFAWDEPVLPMDTNVIRVIERSGGEFGPAAAEALMDLGREVCLARVPRCGACPIAAGCPSRGRSYEPLRKQSRFEGSFRQRRADTLRLVAGGRSRGLDPDAVDSLIRDGLVVDDGGSVALPH